MTDFVFAINNETLLISLSGWLVFHRKLVAERNKKFYGRKSSFRASRYVEKVDNRLYLEDKQPKFRCSGKRRPESFLRRLFIIRQTFESFSARVPAWWYLSARCQLRVTERLHKLRRNRWIDPVGTDGWISYMLSEIDKFIGNDLRLGNLAQSLPISSKRINTARPSSLKWNDL